MLGQEKWYGHRFRPGHQLQVTSWRDLDEEGQVADEPGGEPPNVSWQGP